LHCLEACTVLPTEVAIGITWVRHLCTSLGQIKGPSVLFCTTKATLDQENGFYLRGSCVMALRPVAT
jgi:hypothetical protein